MRSENPEPEGGYSNPAFRAPLIVVSGPSGVGKTTVVERLLSKTTLPLQRAITATTRAKRPGEVDGISYHFWSNDRFRRAIDEGRMLEWELIHGKDYYYGIPRNAVDEVRAAGTGVILVIDVKGAATIRKLYPGDHLSVFIDAPFEELEARLRSRGAETEESIQRRLATAREEIARAGEFDHEIINCDLDRAVEEFDRLIQSQFQERGN